MSQVKIYPERDGDGPPLCTDRCLETAELYNLSSGERQFCESTPVGRPCGVWSFREELAERSELKAAWLDGYITGVEVAADHAAEARRSNHEYFGESDYSEGDE